MLACSPLTAFQLAWSSITAFSSNSPLNLSKFFPSFSAMALPRLCPTPPRQGRHPSPPRQGRLSLPAPAGSRQEAPARAEQFSKSSVLPPLKLGNPYSFSKKGSVLPPFSLTYSSRRAAREEKDKNISFRCIRKINYNVTSLYEL